MASFTTPTDIQTKELFQQLQNAFYERYQVMAPAATPSWCLPANNWAAGVNMQDNAVWKAWYDRISDLLDDAKDNNSYFLRTTSAPPDYEDDTEGSISIYDGSADVGALWLAAVGNSGGPRRYNGTSWSYGRHVTDDVLGPWLIEDIQLALKKLKYTKIVKDGSVTYQPPLTWDATSFGGGSTDDRKYHLHNACDAWRIFWGRCHVGASDTEYYYDLTRKNHDWTTGHDTLNYDYAGNVSLNSLVSSSVSNRMGVMLRTYHASSLVSRYVVASVTEAGYVQITGLPTSISHSADLYLVMDNVHMSEIEWSTGNYLGENEYWIKWAIPPPSDGVASVTFKPINYAGRISGPGRYVKVQNFASSSSSSHSYNFNPSKVFPSYATSEYNLFGFGGNVTCDDTVGGKNIPWHGCQMNKETTWIITWNWTYT